jgi:hypothetical protein
MNSLLASKMRKATIKCYPHAMIIRKNAYEVNETENMIMYIHNNNVYVHKFSNCFGQTIITKQSKNNFRQDNWINWIS